MSNFPTALDSFTSPSDSDYLDTVDHAAQHGDADTAIAALEVKVGIDSSADTGSIDYLLKSTGSSNPGHKHTLASGATDVTATYTEVNVLDGITSTTAELNKLHLAIGDWASFASTINLTGYSAAPTIASARWSYFIKTASVEMSIAGGTSNATTLTGTLPFTAKTSNSYSCQIQNNGSNQTTPGRMITTAGSATFQVFIDYLSTGFATANGKGFQVSFTCEMQ